MNKIINTGKSIFDMIDIDILNNEVDNACGKSVWLIDYNDISIDDKGNVILNVTYEED